MSIRFLASTAAVIGVAAVATAVAPAEIAQAPAQKITRSGVGQVKLGKTHQELRQAGLVGKIRRGCELGGPNTRSARLLAPLEGGVDYTLDSPRRVANVAVTGGARARGVGIGAKIPKIKAAFPKAKVDHGTDEVFGITLVRVPRNGGGRIQFAVSTTTKRVTLIGVPFIPFCE